MARISLAGRHQNDSPDRPEQLPGRYDFTIDYEANTEQSGPFSGMVGPSLFKAFEDQIGVKWEAIKGPVEILVIDHADRPTSN